MNYVRTAMLLAALTALFMGLGYLIGGQGGMLIAFVVALVMNGISYWNSDKIVLAMHGARQVDARSAPDLHAIVARLAGSAGLPMPRVYVIDNPQPNAFATGRDPEHGAVCATTGLLERLSPEEVTGVMAHELAHIKNRDTLIMTVTATIAGAISMLANFAFFFGGNRRDNPVGLIGTIALIFLAPLAAALVQMAISRTREYAADRAGAEISRAPLWLASALEKIALAAKRIPNPTAERNPASAHLFIVNPLSGAGMDNLFSTHPNPATRIALLRQMAVERGMTAAVSTPPAGAAPAPRPGSSPGPWDDPQAGHRPRRSGGPGPWG